jgi:hypothetical protein
MPICLEQAAHLVLDDIGQCTDHEQVGTAARPALRPADRGQCGRRHMSSPSVKVVSMPLPE